MKAGCPILICLLATLPAFADQAAAPAKTKPAAKTPTAAAPANTAAGANTAASATAPTKPHQIQAEQPKHPPIEKEHPSEIQQAARGHHPHAEQMSSQASAVSTEAVDETPVVTHHKITVGGKTLDYTATAAQMPIKNARGETEAHIFYMAYTLDGVADRVEAAADLRLQRRPRLGVDLGSHGSDGAAQPEADGQRRHAPAAVQIDRQRIHLARSHRPGVHRSGRHGLQPRQDAGNRPSDSNGVRGDIQSVGEFIRMYITRNERWLSPLFIAGESYGTFRAAGLAGTLIDKGIARQRHRADFDGARIWACSKRICPTACPMPFICRPAPPMPGITKSCRPICKRRICKPCSRKSEHWAMTDYVSILNQAAAI